MYNKNNELAGLVFDIQRWSLHDGPGIRTVVFLKGCPLSCAWCCNPESQTFYNELVFFKDKCIGCHSCVDLCPYGAIELKEGRQYYNREICKENCYKNGLNEFPCTTKCYGKALRPVASLKTVDEVMHEVMKDEGIYKESKVGGLTISGGETTGQPEFALELLKSAKEKGLTTAIESCGVCSSLIFDKILPYVDYMFMDIKLFDSEKHKKYTGVDNKTIFENVRLVSEIMEKREKDFIVRVPLIPTVSDTEDFEKIVQFVKNNLSVNTQMEIMPYHRLGRGKYADLGRTYEFMELKPYTEEELKPFRSILEKYGYGKVVYRE